jgi:hypothetical protein
MIPATKNPLTWNFNCFVKTLPMRLVKSPRSLIAMIKVQLRVSMVEKRLNTNLSRIAG